MLVEVDSSTATEDDETLFCGHQFPRISVCPQTQQYMKSIPGKHSWVLPLISKWGAPLLAAFARSGLWRKGTQRGRRRDFSAKLLLVVNLLTGLWKSGALVPRNLTKMKGTPRPLVVSHDRLGETSNSSWRRAHPRRNPSTSRRTPAPPAGPPPGRHSLPRQKHNLLLSASNIHSAKRSAQSDPVCHWEMAALDAYAQGAAVWYLWRDSDEPCAMTSNRGTRGFRRNPILRSTPTDSSCPEC